MKTQLEEKVNEILEDLSNLHDWMEKYEYIIQLGKNLPPLPNEYKIDKYLVKGCQSRVWLKATCQSGKIIFEADSDALITKGLIALLIKIISGEPAPIVFNYNFDFIKQIGLDKHLSPTRSNGLYHMIQKIKEEAYKCSQKSQ